jgi:predicted nuclease of predicted toxin-antitoxin system
MAEKSQIRVYLDEDVRPLLAQVLRERGYDVISCIELKLVGLSDENQLTMAIQMERAILTHNIKDFVQLHKKHYKNHCGIILSDHVEFKVLLKRMLRFLSQSTPDSIRGQLVWLSSYD